MRINGDWHRCLDGATRPTVEAGAVGSDGLFYSDRFLIDSGADRTVLSAAFYAQLHWPHSVSAFTGVLQGISGISQSVEVAGSLQFVRDDGGPVVVRGNYAAFTDPAATDMSILGRDVLDNFDVILSRKRNEIILLSQNHQYSVSGP